MILKKELRMNKQELIKYFEEMEYVSISQMGKKAFIDLIEQLDEPQKVTVPQFVADWIEKVGGSLFGLNYDSVSSEIYDWVYEEEGNLKKLHLACAIGYEVEKEKRYYVRFKGMESDDFNYLNFIKFQHAWVLSSIKLDKKFRTEHTKKQLEEAGFGWVFDCPGVEVEEVEE